MMGTMILTVLIEFTPNLKLIVYHWFIFIFPHHPVMMWQCENGAFHYDWFFFHFIRFSTNLQTISGAQISIRGWKFMTINFIITVYRQELHQGSGRVSVTCFFGKNISRSSDASRKSPISRRQGRNKLHEHYLLFPFILTLRTPCQFTSDAVRYLWNRCTVNVTEKTHNERKIDHKIYSKEKWKETKIYTFSVISFNLFFLLFKCVFKTRRRQKSRLAFKTMITCGFQPSQ